jgi:glucoamylase
VWFTVSHGVLNEVYYPTIDRPQVRDLQFLITDGETFFHEEKRDLDSEIESVNTHALGYRVVSRAPDGLYTLTKEFIADPHLPCALIHARVDAEASVAERLKVYVLLAPHLDVGGADNSVRRYQDWGQHILVGWKGQTHVALGADVGFRRSSSGFVGASDGWQDLHGDFQMDWEFERAEKGNVAGCGELSLRGQQEFTVGLAFGDTLHAAVTTLSQSLATPFPRHRQRFVEQWERVSKDILPLEGASGDGGRLYRLSHSLLLSHEDKTYAGAFIASASIPWGEAKGDDDMGGYHLVWTRDMVQTASALLACGDKTTPCRALVYLACTQDCDGGFAQNFWLDGTPYWSGMQLDEVAFPVLLAWRLWRANALGQFDPYPTVRSAAAFLIRQGPMTQQERWEENSGYSPSTLAASIAALICSADFARAREEAELAVFLEEYADFLESHLERWTVTTQGGIVPGIPRHYIRIHPTDIHDPSPDEDPNHGCLTLNNIPPGEQFRFPARDIVDGGFLELVRYGIRKAGDALIEDSLRVVDAVLKVETPFGPCWRRYNHDGYGETADGGPFLGWGKGRAWPILTGERGHYELAAGRDPAPYITAMEAFTSKGGMLPEQIWDEDDRPERGLYRGRFTGSAMPLMWAHAEYLKLLRSATDGQVFDRIPAVADRYLHGHGRTDLEVWKPVRQVRQAATGQVLRIQAPEAFRLRYTRDEWQTVEDTESSPTGLGIGYVDIPIREAQRAPLRFTFYWPQRGTWEGQDYTVEIVKQT